MIQFRVTEEWYVWRKPRASGDDPRNQSAMRVMGR